MRLIDGDRLKEIFKGEISLSDSEIGKMIDFAAEMALIELGKMPTIEAEPVRHGMWECVHEVCGVQFLKCSECGNCGAQIKSKYCRNCGAKMDLEG